MAKTIATGVSLINRMQIVRLKPSKDKADHFQTPSPMPFHDISTYEKVLPHDSASVHHEVSNEEQSHEVEKVGSRRSGRCFTRLSLRRRGH